jgi:ribonuclease HI
MTAREIVGRKLGVEGGEIEEFNMTTGSMYQAMAQGIPTVDMMEAAQVTFGPDIDMKGDRAEAGDRMHQSYLHNINYLKRRERTNCLLFIQRGWSLMTTRARIRKGTSAMCRMCGDKKETYRHLMGGCRVVEAIKKGWEEGWRETEQEPVKLKEWAWGLGERDLGINEARRVAKCLGWVREALAIKVWDEEKAAKWGMKVVRGEYEARMKDEARKKAAKGKKGKKEVPPPEGEETYVYYDGSGREDTQMAGSGEALFEKGREVGAVAGTCPYGTNNVGEFKGALLGLRLAARRGIEELAVIGDCKILTGLMRDGKACKNGRLELVRIQIRKATKKLRRATFYHVTREFNKRADAIAYAASISVEAGVKAAGYEEWDPRGADLEAKGFRGIHAQAWKTMRRQWGDRFIFPLPEGFRAPVTGGEKVNCSWKFFPRCDPETQGRRMRNPLIAWRVDRGMVVVERLKEGRVEQVDKGSMGLKEMLKKVGGGGAFGG